MLSVFLFEQLSQNDSSFLVVRPLHLLDNSKLKKVNEYEKIFINSYEGMFYNKNSVNTLVFADDTYMYTIYGQISKDELIKIAESIKTK